MGVRHVVLWGSLGMAAWLAAPAVGAEPANPTVSGRDASPQAAEKGPVSIVFAGDVMLDNGPGHAVVHGEDPFAEFAPLFARSDINVCNLECVVAEGGDQEDKPYTFLAPTKSVDVLKRYFSAVTVANNHSGDFGKEALREELGLLEKAGIGYFGGGRNLEQARRPLVLERRGKRVALLGYNSFPPRNFEAGPETPGTAWLIEKQCLAEIQQAKTRLHADIVVPYLHWGREGQSSPQAWQRTLAQQMIDAGADAVIGTHAHAVQTVDLYRGKPIVYSLGNFVFDYYPVDPLVFTGWVVRLTFDDHAGVGLQTYVLEIDRTGIPHLVDGAKEMLAEEAKTPPAQAAAPAGKPKKVRPPKKPVDAKAR